MGILDRNLFDQDAAVHPWIVPAPALRLPHTVYVGFADFGSFGVGNMGDFVTTMDEAVQMLVDTNGDSGTGRIFRIDLDVETNEPEAIRDVTSDCIALLSA